MTFGKATPKGEGQIVDEYRELSLKEKYDQAIDHNKAMRNKIQELGKVVRLYNRLRELEVVVMAKEGAVYLKGADLDEYLNALPPRGPLSRADLLKELTPALNKAFGEEYQKYQDEHDEHIAAQIDAEVFLNAQT